MDQLEQNVRDAADAFLAARQAARDAGYIVHWQSDNNVDSIVVSGGPEPVELVKKDVLPIEQPAPRPRDTGL